MLKGLARHLVWIGPLLCLWVVLFAAWPALQQPRLEADDYRYLHHIQQWQAGEMSALEAMTVENRWDHLWFMEEEGAIRFFRPTVVLSYGLDWLLWGKSYALGLTVSNVWIHFLNSILVGILLYRLVGRGWPAVGGAVLFAGLAAHAECIWYIAGRTDSLAAFGFLSAVVLHLYGKRYWALPLFAFGLLTKELVIVAPVVLACYDRWVAHRKIDWKLFGVYGTLAALILLVKQAALGGQGSDFVYPYLIAPLSNEYPNHLWLQFRSYTGNLLAAEVTVPFSDAATVNQLNPYWVSVVGISAFLTMSWLLRKDGRYWLFLAFGFLTWLPTSFVYLSERYIYLPSVAWVSMLILFIATRSRHWKIGLSLLLAVYAVFQTLELRARHTEIVQQSGSVEEMLGQLQPVRDQIKPGDPLLLVNVPGLFVRGQFMQEILRVALNDPRLDVDVLTMMPGQNGTEWKPGDAYPVMGASVELQQPEPNTLLLKGRPPAVGQPMARIMEYGLKQFQWLPLENGVSASNTTFIATVVSDDDIGATAIEFNFFQPLENVGMLIWKADGSSLNEHPWNRRKAARVEVQR